MSHKFSPKRRPKTMAIRNLPGFLKRYIRHALEKATNLDQFHKKRWNKLIQIKENMENTWTNKYGFYCIHLLYLLIINEQFQFSLRIAAHCHFYCSLKMVTTHVGSEAGLPSSTGLVINTCPGPWKAKTHQL